MAGKEVKIPQWAQRYLTEKSIKTISDSVHKVEAVTRAEIVPMIVSRSSAISHVPVILTLLLLLIFIPLEFYYLNWSDIRVANFWLGLSAVAAFFISLFLSRFMWVQRIFTADVDESMQVWNRAELEFYRQKIDHTQARTGILLFVSVMERKAVLLTDQAICELIPQETWSKILKDFSDRLHENDWEKGFITAIQRCGELLTEKFPSQGAQARNELANFLIIKE